MYKKKRTRNLRKISLDTNKPITLEVITPLVNPVPPGREWRVPLLSSLFKIRNEDWVATFDEEDGPETLEGNVIDEMIDNVCTS